MIMPLSGLWSLASSKNLAQCVSLSFASWVPLPSSVTLRGWLRPVPAPGRLPVAHGADQLARRLGDHEPAAVQGTRASVKDRMAWVDSRP